MLTITSVILGFAILLLAYDQWGSRSSDADGVARLYFPISFTAIYNIVGIHTGGDTAIVSEISKYHSLGSTALWVKQPNGGVGTFGLNWIAIGL